MKQIKNKLFLVIMIMILGIGIPSFAEGNQPTPANNPVMKYATKIPMGRKQLAMKFLLAMFGVGVSSVVIFVGLSIYNKLMYGTTQNRKNNASTEDDNYKTPSNMKEALDIFLNKTK